METALLKQFSFQAKSCSNVSYGNMVTLIWIRTKCAQIRQSNPALVADWVYERLQIQVAESHRTQVRILLGTCDGEIVN